MAGGYVCVLVCVWCVCDVCEHEEHDDAGMYVYIKWMVDEINSRTMIEMVEYIKIEWKLCGLLEK